jgi:cellulose synthase/poly-beta-1,6-N-acetylglucosamine synthase-like glycosyltransferase
MYNIIVVALYIVTTIIALYMVRHYVFTLNRLFAHPRQPYVDIGIADWPLVTIFVPCHNEDMVIADMLDNLLRVDYPPDRLLIVPINDRSADRTKEILDDYANKYPNLIKPFHRMTGRGGKGAALKEVSPFFNNYEIHLFFDADYLPGRGLIKQLVAPFFDPEIGAVMGRVVPHNVSKTLLTRLLDLERAGGYQVDQQARMNLGIVPQFGGTVGGVRVSALRSIGGWRGDTLAEDTDITMRLVLNGWQVAYQNRSECYEEVPELWPARIRQISRWATGHNQSFSSYFIPMLRQIGKIRLFTIFDVLMLLGVYLVSPLLLIGWGLSMALFFMGVPIANAALLILAVSTYNTLGNFATFFEVASATRLDGSGNRIYLLPLLSVGFIVNLITTSRATVMQIITSPFNRPRKWQKTTRFRNGSGNGNGNSNGNGDAHVIRDDHNPVYVHNKKDGRFIEHVFGHVSAQSTITVD